MSDGEIDDEDGEDSLVERKGFPPMPLVLLFRIATVLRLRGALFEADGR